MLQKINAAGSMICVRTYYCRVNVAVGYAIVEPSPGRTVIAMHGSGGAYKT
uniref:Uncharacterized protein n=1 Tax=Anopheles maculatus TaxID=74869 RepID=A0A182S971_9DIPT